MNPTTEKILATNREKINAQLKENGQAILYATNRWRAEDFDLYLAQEYKSHGFYVAMDYVPHYRGLIVSELPIGKPTGRLVTREWI